MRKHRFILGLALLPLFFSACNKADAQSRSGTLVPDGKSKQAEMPDNAKAPLARVAAALRNGAIPAHLSANILEAAENGSFMRDLALATAGDPMLCALVDKSHPLPTAYAPDDLVPLQNGAYRTGRNDLSLRREAEASLARMAEAARADGVTLLASSSYRSEAYQKEVYERNVRQSGQETADRESARPGRSQHQTGLVVDFGSITDAFAGTAAGKWLLQNAARYGWSLSFPDGYEHVTGYRWESWHYRYVGPALAALIDAYFDGIQQYALQFIHAYESPS
ncbi:MAG: M15 family metallopeptidase [Spirochaetaceae bacterium]|jgi:D-alanyl-D-alanine carboxypeptidase|nr:M15 family metallopeptidase [Spirochaetaceae bacterium]